jgi:hypothetical protein
VRFKIAIRGDITVPPRGAQQPLKWRYGCQITSRTSLILATRRRGPRTSARIRATNGFTRFACGMSSARFASSDKVTGLAGGAEFQVVSQPKPYKLKQFRIQKKPGTSEGIQYESNSERLGYGWRPSVRRLRHRLESSIVRSWSGVRGTAGYSRGYVNENEDACCGDPSRTLIHEP